MPAGACQPLFKRIYFHKHFWKILEIAVFIIFYMVLSEYSHRARNSKFSEFFCLFECSEYSEYSDRARNSKFSEFSVFFNSVNILNILNILDPQIWKILEKPEFPFYYRLGIYWKPRQLPSLPFSGSFGELSDYFVLFTSNI
jgi:hypothetical protein